MMMYEHELSGVPLNSCSYIIIILCTLSQSGILFYMFEQHVSRNEPSIVSFGLHYMEETMEHQLQMIKCAAIDIGSNSVELVIANCAPDSLELIKDDQTMVRLGENVKVIGEIGQEKREALLTTLRKYRGEAEHEQINVVLAVATEALRKAQNRQQIVDEIERTTGIQVHILSGIVEAALTYHGATYDGTELCADAAVLDVGGGSTELIIVQQRHIAWLSSLPIGSGWLHDQILNSDPPVEDDIQEAQDFLSQYVRQLYIPSLPQQLVVTGSSARALLKIARQMLKKDEQDAHFTRKDLAVCLSMLEKVRSEEVAQRYGVGQERAKVLPSGALLLQAMMEYLHLDEVIISRYGLREGVLLAYARYGEQWLEHPEVRPDDSRVGVAPPVPERVSRNEKQRETFKQSVRNELPKRGKKFLNWIDDVLQNDDIESVHKMRVASRRLRATMDAYESACKAKPFRKTYQQVKQAANLLGAARDTDVMVQHIQEQMEQIVEEEKAGIQWLLDHLASCRKQQQQELETFLVDFDEQRFQQQLASSIGK